jgi:hypothetical protein
MSVLETATMRAFARANATVRLCAAREALWSAERHQADARRTPAESAMCHRVGVATAELAAREQWLHWVEHGTTIRPEADGEWAPTPVPPDTIGGPLERPACRLENTGGHATAVQPPPATTAVGALSPSPEAEARWPRLVALKPPGRSGR